MKLVGTFPPAMALAITMLPAPAVSADQTSASWVQNGFEIRLITPQDRGLLRGICARTQPFDGGKLTSCYQPDWLTWARRRSAVPVAKRGQFKLFLSGGGIREEPATSYLIFPDGTRHVIWSFGDIYGAGEVYWLVDAQKKEVDIIWISGSISCFGPNAEILQKANIAEWLRATPFPGNLLP